MSEIKKTWVIEHDWRCTYCSVVNKGREDKCVNCGKDIDEENCEIIPADMSYENRVQDQKVAEMLIGDPDWVCGYCSHRERAENPKCSQCGSNKGEKKETVASGQDTTIGGGVVTPLQSMILPPAPVTLKPVVVIPVSPGTGIPASSTFTSNIDVDEMQASTQRSKRTVIAIVGLLTATALILLLYWLFAMHQTMARVQETRWTYNVSLLQRQIQNGHDWRNEMHNHYFNASCHTEVRSHHRCDPYQCNPHPERYDCNCRSVCRTERSCRDVCTSTGRRSSSCRNECTDTQRCSPVCATCTRTVYDTCYHSCPDYDEMCDYQYPVWPTVNQATLTNVDHTPIRPSLNAMGNMPCVNDPEILFTNSGVSQCTVDELSFRVTFNAGEQGQYSLQPASQREYDRYRMGTNWSAEYNHAGQFHVLGPANTN